MEVSQGLAVSTLSMELTVTKDSGQRLMVHPPSESEGPRESHVPLGVGERRLHEQSPETTTVQKNRWGQHWSSQKKQESKQAPIAPIWIFSWESWAQRKWLKLSQGRTVRFCLDLMLWPGSPSITAVLINIVPSSLAGKQRCWLYPRCWCNAWQGPRKCECDCCLHTGWYRVAWGWMQLLYLA